MNRNVSQGDTLQNPDKLRCIGSTSFHSFSSQNVVIVHNTYKGGKRSRKGEGGDVHYYWRAFDP